MNMTVRRQEGMALILALLAIIIIFGALGLIMMQVHGSKQATDESENMIVAEEVATSGIDQIVKLLWHDYKDNLGGDPDNWPSYRQYLDDELQIPINEDLNFNGVQDAEEKGNGRDGFETYPAGYDQRGMAMLQEPLEIRGLNDRVIGTIDQVYIARYDEVDQSHLTVRAVANVNGRTKTAVQSLTIGGEALEHTQFAIMANNISCILCHAEILSLPLMRNTDPAQYNTFDRVKVASLESLMIRTSAEVDSHLEGTLYTRGRVYNESGNEYSAAGLASSAFRGKRFNSDGTLYQDSQGKVADAPLVNAALDANGKPVPNANLYLDYALDEADQTDGRVPSTFPAPYPDENGNRLVDNAEFDAIVESADGRIDFTGDPSQPNFKAGVAYGVPAGNTYSGTALPTTSNGALDTLSQDGFYNGNLILVGTAQDPIEIDRTVAINGDLVIAGKIKGNGQLLVRGNTYIAGDVTYADDANSFGQYTDENGVVQENALALVSGGSVLMGDYLTVRGVNVKSKDYDQYPDHTQFSIDMRAANKSTKVGTETLKWGYKDSYSVDAGKIVSGRQGQQFSFTNSELQLFNNMELEKAIADPTYKPRFYGLRASQPNEIYVFHNGNEEHAVHYYRTGVKKLATYITEQGLDPSILQRAVYHYTSPAGNWISESTLRNIWFNDELSRPDTGRPFQFDGLIYSNNAIFCIVRSDYRHNSNTHGRMVIRGGVIAPDLGMFVPGKNNAVQDTGLQLYYDERVERFLTFHDWEVVAFEREAFYFEKTADAEI